ncbi:MAG: DUF4336 domain-containing protein [Polyangiales bacterium]
MPRLEEIDDGLWRAEGPPVSFYGFPYPTRMVVARLDDGALWVWSPVALDEGLRREIDALGAPRFAVEPNKLHHLALSQWVEAWPELQLFAPPGLADKRRDLRFAGELEDRAPAAWEAQIDQVRVEGSFALTEVLFFHRASRTCLIGDLVQRLDPEGMAAWRRWVMKADGLVGPDGSTPREWRLTFVHRDRAREAVARAIAWGPKRLIVAHGACVDDDGAAELRRALSWLDPPAA